MHRKRAIAMAALSWAAIACGEAAQDRALDGEIANSMQNLSFEEFKARYIYQEPWADGVYIFNGDTPVANEKQLYEIYELFLNANALIVNRVGGADDRWGATQALNLTYCISNNFGSRKNQVISAMASATENGWENFANVNFTYDSSQDANCTASNTNVVFDVRPVSGQSYAARAFFPSYSRSQRNILIDSTAFTASVPLSGILGHEVGHTLGFRHEHTRPEAGTCFEDNNWRALTQYDSASIMHYPQCNGSSNTLAFTALDAAGAESLYGAPGGDPGPGPGEGTPQSGSDSRSISRGQTVLYNRLSVVPGTSFVAQITGTGDADLYVRWDADATRTQFNCRPYLNGSNETCDLVVPSGVSEASVMVYGYTAATYTLTVDWFSP